HGSQGDLAQEIERPAPLSQLQVEAELAAVEGVVCAEIVPDADVGPGERGAGRHDQVFGNVDALVQGQVAIAGQQIHPPAAAAPQVGPEVDVGAVQGALDVDGDVAGKNAGEGDQLCILEPCAGVEERPGQDRQAGRAGAEDHSGVAQGEVTRVPAARPADS